jgi:hypothetical protein
MTTSLLRSYSKARRDPMRRLKQRPTRVVVAANAIEAVSDWMTPIWIVKSSLMMMWMLSTPPISNGMTRKKAVIAIATFLPGKIPWLCLSKPISRIIDEMTIVVAVGLAVVGRVAAGVIAAAEDAKANARANGKARRC